MSRFPFSPERRSWLLVLTLLLASSAGAQQTGDSSPVLPVVSPQAVEPCATEPQLLDVQISGASRGVLPVLQRGAQVWVPADALLESEAAYASGQVTCDSTVYVSLNSDLNVSLDPAEGRIIIRPSLRLLPGNVLDFSVQTVNTLPVEPLITLGTAARLSGQLGASLSQQVTVYGTYAADHLSAGAGLREASSDTQAFSVVGTASAAYRLGQTWTLSAQVNPVLLGTRADSLQAFSGVELTGRSERGIVLPDLTLALPLDSDIILTVDDQVLQQFHAAAGTLVLKNLPLASQSGELLVHIRDLSGNRVQVVPFQNLSDSLGQHAYQVDVRAGWLNAQPMTDLTGYYGLSDRLTLQVLGTIRPDAWNGSVEALYDTDSGQFRAGLGLQPLTSVDSQSETALKALIGYGLSRGPFTFGIGVNIPVTSPSQTTWTGNTAYTAGAVALGLGVAYDASGQRYGLNASATATLNEFILGGQLSYAQDRWKVGLRANWVPTDRVTVSAQANRSLPPDSAADTGGVGITYRATDQATLNAVANLDGTLGAGLELNGPVRLSAAADTLGNYQITAASGIVFTGPGVLLTSDNGTSGLLVHTGIPDLPLRLNGGSVQRADAKGDAVFLGLSSNQGNVVSVDLDTLGIDTVVGDDSAEVNVQANGLSILDWARNFHRVRWVQLFWPDGTPASQAQLQLPSKATPIWTDDQGWAQLDVSAQVVTGTLSTDGGQLCLLLIPVTGERATCQGK